MPLYYKLDENKNPVPSTFDETNDIWKGDNRRVAKTDTLKGMISTVFLITDHGGCPDKPVLFETMVFGGPLDGEMDRYCTWQEAVEGHAKMVERVNAA